MAGSVEICFCELCQALLGLAGAAAKNQRDVLTFKGRLAVVSINRARRTRGDPPT